MVQYPFFGDTNEKLKHVDSLLTLMDRVKKPLPKEFCLTIAGPFSQEGRGGLVTINKKLSLLQSSKHIFVITDD